MRNTLIVLVPAALAVSGCQTWGPSWSEVTGSRYHLTQINRSATIVENVDGRSPLEVRTGGYRVARIDPGRHAITLQGVPLRPGWQGYLKEYTLDAKPCQRYYINAQFDGPLVPSEWKPVIDHVEPIAGCSVAAK